MPIVTEKRRLSRSHSETHGPSTEISSVIKAVAAYTTALIKAIKDRLQQPEKELLLLIKDVFFKWDKNALDKLIESAVTMVRSMCCGLKSQYITLSAVYAEIDQKIPEADKWLKICSKPKLYTGKEVILRLALASFVKSPLEARAETIGSVISRHCIGRGSLKMKNLSDEVFVGRNGSPYPSAMADRVITQL